jgi:hypothetical protein
VKTADRRLLKKLKGTEWQHLVQPPRRTITGRDAG